VTVTLGSVIAACSEDQHQDWMEIACLPDVNVDCGDWDGAEGEILEDGRTRYFFCLCGRWSMVIMFTRVSTPVMY
jgi:hypothetical protein